MADCKYLQGLLDVGGDVTIPAINPANGTSLYEISEPLVLKSGTHVTLDGCVLRLCDGVYSNVFISEGAWDETAPSLSDIELIGKNGALIDGGNFNGLTEKTANKNGLPSVRHNTFILFRNVHGFKVSGLSFTRPRYWNLTFHCCSEGVIENIVFDSANNAPNQDGIDLRRGCHDIVIDNISGSTGDDTVALTGLMGKNDNYFSVEGLSDDIYNVKISNIDAEVTGGHGIIRLLCHDGIKLYNIEISNVYDRLIDTRKTRNYGAIRIGDANYYSVTPAKDGDLHDVTISNVVTNAIEPIKIHGNVPNLTITDLVVKE